MEITFEGPYELLRESIEVRTLVSYDFAPVGKSRVRLILNLFYYQPRLLYTYPMLQFSCSFRFFFHDEATIRTGY